MPGKFAGLTSFKRGPRLERTLGTGLVTAPLTVLERLGIVGVFDAAAVVDGVVVEAVGGLALDVTNGDCGAVVF